MTGWGYHWSPCGGGRGGGGLLAAGVAFWAAYRVLAWVRGHVWQIAGTSAVVLAGTAVTFLLLARWAGNRDARSTAAEVVPQRHQVQVLPAAPIWPLAGSYTHSAANRDESAA